MRHFRTHSRVYTPMAAILMSVFLHACTRWTPVSLEPAATPVGGQVRATLRTGQRVIVKSPVIVNDTLREAVTGGVRWSRPQPRSGIPLAQISTLEVQKADAGATVGLIVVTGVAVAAITLLMLAKAFKDAGWGDGVCWFCGPS